MLNNPGEDVAAESEVVTSSHTSVSGVVVQIVLIALASAYLFGMVWLYVRLPWIALAVTAIAVAIAAIGIVVRLRTPPTTGC